MLLPLILMGSCAFVIGYSYIFNKNVTSPNPNGVLCFCYWVFIYIGRSGKVDND